MIRRATDQDAAAIKALWNSVITQTTITFTSDTKTNDEVAGMIADPARAVHVAEHKGAFAGFGLIGPFRAGSGYAHTVEHTVYLHPVSQGAGLGRALMAALEGAARVAGHHVMVGALNGSNQNAIEFHKRLGFQQVGVIAQAGRKDGIWHDLVLMQKILQNGH